MNFTENISRYTRNRIFQKSSRVLIIKVVGLASGFILTFLIGRYYGAGSLGVLSISLSLVQIAVLFSVCGLDNLILKITARLDNEGNAGNILPLYKQLLYLTLLTGLLTSTIMYFSAGFLASVVFSKPFLKPYFQLAPVMILPTTFLLLHASALRGLDKTEWFSFFRETSRFCLALPIACIMIFFFNQVSSGPLLSYSIAVIIAAFMSFVVWRQALKKIKAVRQPHSLHGFTGILKLAIPFFFITVQAQLSPLLNPLILGVYGTTAEVGIFNVAFKIAGLLALPLMVVNMATAAFYAGSDQHSEAIQKTAIASTKLIFWTSLPMLIVCLTVPEYLLQLFGSTFDSGALAMIMIAIAQFINAITGSVGVVMQMTGHEKPWGIILFCTILINLLLLLYLVPIYGLNGAAFSMMISIILNNIAGAVYLKIKVNIRTYYFPFFTHD